MVIVILLIGWQVLCPTVNGQRDDRAKALPWLHIGITGSSRCFTQRTSLPHISALMLELDSGNSNTMSGSFCSYHPEQPSRARRIPLHKWDEHRSIIEELYSRRGMSISDVAKVMADSHDFHARYPKTRPLSASVLISPAIGSSGPCSIRNGYSRRILLGVL